MDMEKRNRWLEILEGLKANLEWRGLEPGKKLLRLIDAAKGSNKRNANREN
jgi:hypothetical protein